MAELEKAITTQEELDAVISERLKRKDEQVAKKYGDYEELKGRLSEQETRLSDYAKKLEEAGSSYKAATARISELEGRVKGYELGELKRKVAQEKGIPAALAGRLSGATEEELAEDASELFAALSENKKSAPPLANPERGSGSNDSAALKNLLSKLKA